ncbi:Card1-like endonuclease domain-containing protein [uncultured Parabacteroides sp.]|uniref:Card1-like endonuclease domain-containing protein n=1 Tax=uncultured Parabacteroides sp. TaxID=512312 RepID=UPI0025F22F6B|nr:DUF1887 family CARF protein [uncultured Parabacteroides sp.]
MSRIIVNIISEQTIPNYLFVKEVFLPGDSLLFIASQKFSTRIDWIVKTLGISDISIESILFPEGGEERWVDMEFMLKEKLSSEHTYFVNLTGGTKYMSLLVQHVFETFSSSFYYIPYPQNILLQPLYNDSIPLKYRLSVHEYLSNYNVSFTEKKLIRDESYCDYFFDRFVNGSMDYKVLDLLRSYRNDKKRAIVSIETCKSTEKRPCIEGLADFLEDVHFQVTENGFLKRAEIEYLTGGWFEEYMFYKIQKNISPQDIKLSVLIQRTETSNLNDLDVVFVSGNKLFVIECKTGIAGVAMFNQTVYKASAIKEAVLGLSANTFIASLAQEDDNLRKTAKNMGVYYKCREDIDNPSRFESFMNQIKAIANN